MKSFGGPVLFLNRNDINTDEIIPAKYLTEIEKDALKPHLLEDLKLEGFSCGSPALHAARAIVTRANFGCGSSREHAPWALEVNRIHMVVAENFARIFRQNMFNCGLLAVEQSAADIEELFAFGSKAQLSCAVNLEKKELLFADDRGNRLVKNFALNEFDEALVRAGGWVEYADARY